jgi:hypothetical protein
MSGGIKTLLLSTALLATGCASDDGKLTVRAIADPLAAAGKPGDSALAQARGLLALGSVGLALEGFHKALRAQPDSIEALAGIAACYDQMGRYDLSRSNYEAALAIAPRNAVLLDTFAASLARQGRTKEATAVRAEAARADADDSETLALAAAPPVTVPVAVQPAAPVATTQWTIEPAQPQRTASAVTVPLPPVPEVRSEAAAAPRPPKAMAASPAVEPPAPQPVKAIAAHAARLIDAIPPRLERLSPGIVALLTGDGPIWSSEIVSRSRQSITMRFVAAKPSGPRPNIRLLNAAREQGLAARTREVLLDRGWRKIAIGDASDVRERSVVLYPSSRQRTGQSLAGQFGFNSVVSGSAGELIVLLGRDAPDVAALRTRG